MLTDTTRESRVKTFTLCRGPTKHLSIVPNLAFVQYSIYRVQNIVQVLRESIRRYYVLQYGDLQGRKRDSMVHTIDYISNFETLSFETRIINIQLQIKCLTIVVESTHDIIVLRWASPYIFQHVSVISRRGFLIHLLLLINGKTSRTHVNKEK